MTRFLLNLLGGGAVGAALAVLMFLCYAHA